MDPTGSTIDGGRFNPPEIPTLYFCDTEECSEAEYLKQLSEARQWGRGVSTAWVFPPKRLYSIEVTLSKVLDLTDADPVPVEARH